MPIEECRAQGSTSDRRSARRRRTNLEDGKSGAKRSENFEVRKVDKGLENIEQMMQALALLQSELQDCVTRFTNKGTQDD